jgi:hypothetical protein
MGLGDHHLLRESGCLVDAFSTAGVQIEATAGARQPLTEHLRESPSGPFFRRSSVKPAEAPAGHIGALRLSNQLLITRSRESS